MLGRGVLQLMPFPPFLPPECAFWPHPWPITSRQLGEEGRGEAGSDWWVEEGPNRMSYVFCHLALLLFH